MAQNPTLQAGRAIASTMVQRYTFFPLITLTAIGLVGWILSLTLATVYSNWWLLLSFLLFLWLALGFFAAIASYFIYSKLRPRKLSKAERQKISQFTTDFGIKYAATKGVKKNPTALSALLAWKLFKSRGKKPATDIIMDPINDAKDLKTQFQAIVKLFN